MKDGNVYLLNKIRVCQLVLIKMITYRIQIEQYNSIFFLKKEYLTYPQALKALRMMHPFIPKKYGNCIIKIYEFTGETRSKLMS
jgi:hypothetical protein